MARLYCSGPLFCVEEVGGMTAIANVLEQAAVDEGGRIAALRARLPKNLGKQKWAPELVAQVLRDAAGGGRYEAAPSR